MQTILVVDDELHIADLLDEFLTKKGFQVIKCNGGREALNVIKSDKPIDLMLLDSKMPDVDGLTVLEEMDRIRSKIPTIILTGSIDWKIRHEQSRNVRTVLIKPLILDELLDKINEILKK
jgi:DNA-binding NtrC family response regulator